MNKLKHYRNIYNFKFLYYCFTHLGDNFSKKSITACNRLPITFTRPNFYICKDYIKTKITDHIKGFNNIVITEDIVKRSSF